MDRRQGAVRHPLRGPLHHLINAGPHETPDSPLLAILAAAGPATAQQQGDREAGQRIAGTWCRNCHVVARGGTGSANDAAPTFVSIAMMPSTTGMPLRAFLQTPHDRMPDYQFARAEMDDVIAYLLSLRGQ